MSVELPARYGKYELVELVARGGMAEVFRARTMGIGGFEKWVAIKKVLPHLSENHEYMTMLIDEAKISVTLNHANIAQVLDLGRIDESYYIAMEYVHGMDLATILKTCAYNNFTIPFEHTIHVCMQVCSGLFHAHCKTDETGDNLGIIHRDVSPHNVLISYDGEVKVIDFGVAKASIKLTHTMSGIIKGKLLYMAPEQAMAMPLDPRADLFAVGLVLYKMTTGRLPFEGDNEFQVYNKLVAGKVVSPRKLNPAVPEGLEQVIMKVLSKKPQARHDDAMALRNDLGLVLHDLDPAYTSSRLARFMETYFPPRALSSGETPAVRLPVGDDAGAHDRVGGRTQPDTPSPGPSPGIAAALPPEFETVSDIGDPSPNDEDAGPTHPTPGLPEWLLSSPGIAAPPSGTDMLDISDLILDDAPVMGGAASAAAWDAAAGALPLPPSPPPDAAAPAPAAIVGAPWETAAPAAPPRRSSDEPTAIVPSMPGLRVVADPRTQDMHTVAAFIPPVAPSRAGRFRTAILAMVVLGLLAGTAGGLWYLDRMPGEDARGGGDAADRLAEVAPVAAAVPVRGADPDADLEEALAAPPDKGAAPAEVGPPAPPKNARSEAAPASGVREGRIQVLLDSTPAGAEVYQGDVLVGTTPARLVLPRKEGAKRRYRIKAAGYNTAKPWVSMDKDADVKVRLRKKR